MSGITIAQVIINDSSDKTITGAYVFDRENGGSLAIPALSYFPTPPSAGEIIWRIDLNTLYRRSDDNNTWQAVDAKLNITNSSIGDLVYYNGTEWVRLPAGVSGQFLKTIGISGAPIWATLPIPGDVLGPSFTINNSVPRFDGYTGKILKDSLLIIDDEGNIVNNSLINGIDVSNHAIRHILDGYDQIDGDKLDIDFIPSNYNRTTDSTFSISQNNLSAHLNGIDKSLELIKPTNQQDGYLAIASNGGLSYLGGNSNGDFLSWNSSTNQWDTTTPVFDNYFANGGESGGSDRILGNIDDYKLTLITANTIRLELNSQGVLIPNATNTSTALTIKAAENQIGDLVAFKDINNVSIAYFNYRGFINIGLPGASLPNSPISAVTADANSWIQINIQNKNNGAAASSDIVATADNGDDSNFYVDLGINSSTYSQSFFSVSGPNDSYLVAQGGCLTIGTGTEDKHIHFFTGGTELSNLRVEISDEGIDLLGNQINNVSSIDGYNLSNQFHITTSHINNISNPHSTSIANIGSGTLAQLNLAISDTDVTPTTRQIIAGNGLTGGGDFSSDKTIAVAAGDTSITVNADSIQVGVISDINHGSRSGGTTHAIATSTTAGFESAADKAKLDSINLDGYVVDWDSVSSALGGKAVDGYYIFRSDGYGSGEMVKNIPKITNVLKVGKIGDDVDYTSIAEGVSVAIANGASGFNYWQIVVYPGVYIEPAFTMVPGIILTADNSTAVEGVWILAQNPSVDLITMNGGEICGITLAGITNPSSCLIRCSTPGSFSVFEKVTFDSCTNGVIISNGASAIFNSLAVTISLPGQDIGKWITVTGAGTSVNISNCAAIVPVDVLPYYSTNPIQTLFDVSDGAILHISSAIISIAHLDNTSNAFLVNSGAHVTLLSCNITDCANALHIGSVGSNAQINFSGLFLNNVLNFFCESSTGTLFANASSDSRKVSMVNSLNERGTVNYQDTGTYTIIGNVSYMFKNTNKQAPLADFIYDSKSTGVCEGGLVTTNSGLYISVTDGEGWIRRSETYNDVEGVIWEAAPALLLSPSTINYVQYDSVSGNITASLSSPSSETGILLATVITGVNNIRYIHRTRKFSADIENIVQDYILNVSPQYLKSGLTVTPGTFPPDITVGSGSYYLGLDTINYDGYLDSTWSYFYGTNGINEVSNVNDLDGYYYDNSGTLTLMTSGYYRVDYLVLTSDGRLNMIYGTSQHSTDSAALSAMLPTIPTFILPSNMPLAKICVKQGVGLYSITDVRPVRGSGGSGGSSGVTVHSALGGLNADDHSQYLLTSGARNLTGDLNLGGYSISNVNNVDGVDVSTHASRHLPGGSDALTIGNPVSIGIANSDGSATSFSRSDHVHSHGSQTEGTLHANVTTSVSGFMSASDKTKLNTFTPTTPAQGDVLYHNGTGWVNLGAGISGQYLKTQGATANPVWGTVSGFGDVTGPGSSTDNTIARFDLATGKIIQGSLVTIDDLGNISTPGLVDGYDLASKFQSISNSLAGIITDHGGLLGLGDDDHTQYLLASGTRAMTGSLNMGGYNITNISLIDGYNLESKFYTLDSHLINTSNPHSTSIANIGSGTLAQLNSAISDADVTTTARQVIAGNGLTGGGDFSSDKTIAVAAADSSITVNADSIQVGVISDTNHGTRSGGTTHADVTTSVSGFMSGTDKTKLNTFAPITSAQGDILYHNGTSWVNLGAGISGQYLKTQGATANPVWGTVSGFGDVTGPGSSTDNTIARFDLATGKIIQGSLVTIDDSGNISTPGLVDGYDLASRFQSISNSLAGIITDHGGLLGLGDDDHTQYLLTSGTRAMTGSLNMGGYNITNISLIDGYNLESKFYTLDSHLINTSNPHSTSIANIGSGTLAQLNSAISDADITTTARQVIAGNGLTGGGDFSSDKTIAVAAADSSITVNADSIQVGVISDTNHGTRGGGTLHADVTTSVAGFMSATDKTKLNTFAPITSAQGEILYHNGTNWVNLGVGVSGQYLKTQGAAANPTWGTIAGGGDVTGPASSTDNAVARFNLATGKIIKNSSVTIDDSGNIATTGTVDGVDVSTLSSTVTSHTGSTSNPHSTSIANIGSGTLAQLNSAISDADITTTTRQVIAGNGLTGGGDFSSDRTIAVAAADSSITVNADSIQVGVISDTNHGTRGGGTLHANVTTSVAGFMSATDKTKTDLIISNSHKITISSTAPSTPTVGDIWIDIT